MTMPLRAALYLRVSTARQAEHDVSFPDQKRQGEAYCAARVYELVETFTEPGASATNDRRPKFQRMTEAGSAKPALFEIVLVHSFSGYGSLAAATAATTCGRSPSASRLRTATSASSDRRATCCTPSQLPRARGQPRLQFAVLFRNGVPCGIRTRVAAVRGRCPGPLDERDRGRTSLLRRHRADFNQPRRHVTSAIKPAACSSASSGANSFR